MQDKVFEVFRRLFMSRDPELMKLLRTKSIMRYVPPAQKQSYTERFRRPLLTGQFLPASIKNALKKAHLVCYVARESKGIEENTLQKIKEYMQKNVTEMVGIHNIPLQPKMQYDGDDYIGDITKEVELKDRKNGNIEDQLRRAIPDGMYRKTVGISALPGLCALAIHNGRTSIASPQKNCYNPAVAKSLGRLRDQKRTFLSRTSDAELLKVSRLNKLRNVIIESCSDTPKRIKKASLIRLSRLLQDDYLADISTQKKSIGEFCNSISNRTDRFVSKLGSARDQMKRNMRHSVKNVVYDFFRKDIEGYVTEYQTGMELDIKNISIELPEFNAESFDFKQLGSALLSIGGYAFSGAMIGTQFCPGFGTIVGLIAGLLTGIGLWVAKKTFFKDWALQKYKNKASEKVEECADETWDKISDKIENISNQLASKTDECIAFASKQLESANQSLKLISDLESKIKKQAKQLDNEIEMIGV